jgi:peptidoglycan hydrolase-like protein with peptidoglycan-binding domain
MTPRQAQVALLSFVLLAGGVVYNALYMQGDAGAKRAAELSPGWTQDGSRRAQAPASGKPAPQADATKRTAQSKPGKADVVTGALPEEVGADTVRAIQRKLAEHGFGPVPSDGVVRPVTRAAIMAYEHDNSLPLTGEASDALLKRLVFGAPATADVTGAREVRSSHAETVVKQVQRLLTANGYRPGPIDGRLSPETVIAIRAFEKAQGMTPPKGRVSAEVLLRLQDTSGKLKAAEVR